MKRIIGVVSILLLIYLQGASQEFKYDPSLSQYKYGGYTFNFQNFAGKFNPEIKQKLVEAYFKVYPALVKEFNPTAKREVTLTIDSLLSVVGNNSGSTIRLHPKWLEGRPEDIDVLTHHLMNVLQGYDHYQVPFWLETGISDYARFKYGVNNKAANWFFSTPLPYEKYFYGYRTTGRFLTWVDSKVKKGFVRELYQQLNKALYADTLWVQLTGKTIDELWSNYLASPSI